MNDSHHLSEAELLRLQDGEMEEKTHARASAHLQNCWHCRHRLERLNAVVLDFVAYCDVASSPASQPDRAALESRIRIQVQLAPPPSRWTRLRAFFTAMLPPSTHMRAMASAICAIAAICYFLAGEGVAPLEAGEMLRQTSRRQAATLRSLQGAVLHRKVNVRSQGYSVDWESWRGKGKKPRVAWHGSAPIARSLERTFQSVNWSGDDLISVSHFASWRDSLARREEHVIADAKSGQIEIRTRDLADAADFKIREAVLTLRGSDFHPVAQRILTQSGGSAMEFELKETAYEVLPETVLESTLESAIPSAPSISPVTAFPAASEAVSSEPSPQALEESEARLLETLHELGFDRNLSPRVHREENRVLLQLIVQSEEQKTALLQRLTEVPFLNLQIWDADSPAGAFVTAASPVGHSPKARYRAEALLRQRLDDYFGSHALREAFVERSDETFRSILREALALERLAARYPNPDELSAGARASVANIARDHISSIRKVWPNLRLEIAVVFGPLPPPLPKRDSCSPWSQSAATLARTWKEMAGIFDMLAADQDLDHAPELSGEAAMERFRQAIIKLDQEMDSVCVLR